MAQYYVTRMSEQLVRVAFNPLDPPLPDALVYDLPFNYIPSWAESYTDFTFYTPTNPGSVATSVPATHSTSLFDIDIDGYTCDFGILSGSTFQNLFPPHTRLVAVDGVPLNSAEPLPFDVTFPVFTTTPVLADPPTIDSVSVGDRTFTITLTPPVNTGSSPLVAYALNSGFQLGYRSYVYSAVAPTLVLNNGAPIAINLPPHNGASRTYKLRSRNEQGDGAATEVTITTQGIPSPPTSFTSIWANNEIYTRLGTQYKSDNNDLTALQISTNGGSTYSTTLLTDPTLNLEWVGYPMRFTVPVGFTFGTRNVTFKLQNSFGASSAPTATSVRMGGLYITRMSAERVRVSFNPRAISAPVLTPLQNTPTGPVPRYAASFYLSYYLPDTFLESYRNVIDVLWDSPNFDPYTFDIGNISTQNADFVSADSAFLLADGTTFPRFQYPISEIPAETPTVPAAPTITSVVPGNAKATIYATVSDAGSSPLVAFVTSKGFSTTAADYKFYNATSPIVITGLTNGASYQFSLHARNWQGNSAGTLFSFVAGTVPDAPTLTSAVGGDGQITVTKTGPVDNGGFAITSFDYSLDGGATHASLPITSQGTVTFDIPGLTNGTPYTVTLRAVNSAGAGAWSNALTATPYGLPTAPTITLIMPGNGTLEVTYTAPADDGGSPITHYEYSLDGGATYINNGLDNPFTITGLSNGLTYEVVLRAVTAIGAGAPSEPVPAVPTAGDPVPNRVYAVGERAVRVQFSSAVLSLAPLHQSSTGNGDALNPRSWSVFRWNPDSGQAVALTVLSVSQGVDHYTYDILTLEPFTAANTYQMGLTANIRLSDNSPYTYGSPFSGSIATTETTLTAQSVQRGLIIKDIANASISPVKSLIGGDYSEYLSGTLVINSSGDYVSMAGESLVRKLITRRLLSQKGDFFHLPNYGANLQLKGTFSTHNMRQMAKDIEMQIMQEPEIEAAKVTLTYQAASSALVVQVQARMRSTGQNFAVSLNLPSGSVQF